MGIYKRAVVGVLGMVLVLSCLDRDPVPTAAEEKGRAPMEEEGELKEVRVPGAVLGEYAFDRLTPLGAEIFEQSRQFLQTQKHSDYQRYAQPLQCVVNVAYVLQKAGMRLPSSTRYSVPNMLQYIQQQGGQLYTLPTYKNGDVKPILQYLQKHFQGRLPTGALVAGCTVQNCQTSEAAGAHLAILGDKDHKGQIMLYHNNWYRPNTNKGIRAHYMVPVSSFYDDLRPREWMATPWVRLQQNDDGKLQDLFSITPGIDDLDPLNPKYFITIAVFKEMVQELAAQKHEKHHVQITRENVHRKLLRHHPDRDREVCQTQAGLKNIGLYRHPQGPQHREILQELSSYSGYRTPYNASFEFMVRERQKDWYAIQFYMAKKYYGVHEKVWLQARHGECKKVKEWLR